MEAAETKLKLKHSRTDAKLNFIVTKIWAKEPSYISCNKVAKKVGVVGATVYNYCTGRGKDGFLKEIILEELKKL